MHFIVGLATSAEAGLKTFENACTDHSSSGATGAETFFPSQGESGAHRLVRAVCKAFSHTGACEKSGQPKEFEAFLQPCVPAKVNKLISFRGERFNVVFKNGGATYHHKDDLLAYLDTCEAPTRLLQAVRADLSVPVYVAGCCALVFGHVFVLDFNAMRREFAALKEEVNKMRGDSAEGIKEEIIHLASRLPTSFDSR
ncbi:hypothetical protein Bbelb_241050 [Branchiostoma belcheri]|nr:hypothetical protein Bbelb_241050 [Branchiostoma belcheri]